MKNRLFGATAYLAGPIDFASDDGVSFRQAIRANLDTLGIRFLDPTCKPIKDYGEVGQEKRHHQELRLAEKYEELTTFAKRIRRVDLRLIDKCDFVIAYVDTDIHMCGTYDEIFTAEDQQKPVLLLFKNGKRSAPLWLFGAFNYKTEMFDHLDDLVKHLQTIAYGSEPLGSKWVELWNSQGSTNLL